MIHPSPCVIFDLDDTLYLERDFVRSGFYAVDRWCADVLGVGGVQKVAQKYFEAGERGNIFDLVLEQLTVKRSDETLSAMVRVYREHFPTITLMPDTVRCLAALKGQARMGLLTDGNPVTQWRKIEALGIRNTFKEIVVTGDWGIEFFKPHLRGFLHFERQFDSPSSQFIYVADNPAKDFTGPHELGWRAVRVKRPTGLYNQRPAEPNLVQWEMVDLESLPDLVRSLS
jgi:putative hydrolase of the HAD superfamily